MRLKKKDFNEITILMHAILKKEKKMHYQRIKLYNSAF
jgi:hypothetical protein